MWITFIVLHRVTGNPLKYLLIPITFFNSFSLFKVVTTESAKIPLVKLLVSLGVVPEAESSKQSNLSDRYIVLLDGRVVGRVHQNRAQELAKQLRYFKTTEQYDVSLRTIWETFIMDYGLLIIMYTYTFYLLIQNVQNTDLKTFDNCLISFSSYLFYRF